MTVGLLPPSPSSCLSPLFHTPHSCKISCDITGMTSHSVRCDVSHKPDADHLHPWKHHRCRLPRHPLPQPQPRTQTSAAVQENGQCWSKYGQQSSNRSSGVCSNWEQTAANQSKAGVKCCEAGVEGVCAWRKAVWKVDVRQRPRPCGQHG